MINFFVPPLVLVIEFRTDTISTISLGALLSWRLSRAGHFHFGICLLGFVLRENQNVRLVFEKIRL